MNLVSGNYYLDGPVFLKSGIILVGIVGDDAPFSIFYVHGSGTGADGVINADGVSGALVSMYPEIGGCEVLVRTTPRCRTVVAAMLNEISDATGFD